MDPCVKKYRLGTKDSDVIFWQIDIIKRRLVIEKDGCYKIDINAYHQPGVEAGKNKELMEIKYQ